MTADTLVVDQVRIKPPDTIVSPRLVQDVNDDPDAYNRRRALIFGDFTRELTTNTYQGRFQPELLAQRPSIIQNYLLTQDGVVTLANKRQLGRSLAKVIAFTDQNPLTSIPSHLIGTPQRILGITS